MTLRTHIQQTDREGMLDMVRFVQVVGGYVESIKHLDEGRYSVLVHFSQTPMLAADVQRMGADRIQSLTDHDMTMLTGRIR